VRSANILLAEGLLHCVYSDIGGGIKSFDIACVFNIVFSFVTVLAGMWVCCLLFFVHTNVCAVVIIVAGIGSVVACTDSINSFSGDPFSTFSSNVDVYCVGGL